MKRAILGALVGAGLVVGAIGLFDGRAEVMAQRVTPFAPATVGSGDLIAVPAAMGDKGQLLTVIDPRLQSMAVYTVEASTGKIALRSVRNIHYDLQMSEFNSENPLPREIRLQLEQR